MTTYLKNHDVHFEPIVSWPGEVTTSPRRSQFKSSYAKTLDLLDRELCCLEAENIIFQLYLERRQIRNDGLPRADSRTINPGVIVSFDSIHGPLQYPCDCFDTWPDNLRGIALALEALRKVDRYGVTKRAEQYKGWQQLPYYAPTTVDGAPRSPQDAARLLCGLVPGITDSEILSDQAAATTALRTAQYKMHPDRGGNADIFKKVMEAERLLNEHFS